MKLELKRIAKKSTYTIGKLFIDGKYFCDTIEDRDRGLTSKMSLESIKRIKIPDETAIPTGTYEITMDVTSPKYSNFTKYPWAKFTGGKLPRLKNVPGYEGVLIHVGNTEKSTSGCLIVGENKAVGKVLNSTATFTKLYKELLKDKNNLSIEIS